MSDLGLRARSTTELVDATFTLYRRHPLQYILLTALAYAPWLLVQLVLMSLGLLGDDPLANPVLQAILAVGRWLTFSVVSGVLTMFAARSYLGESPDLATTAREALPRVPAVMAAALIKSIALGVGLLLF